MTLFNSMHSVLKRGIYLIKRNAKNRLPKCLKKTTSVKSPGFCLIYILECTACCIPFLFMAAALSVIQVSVIVIRPPMFNALSTSLYT